MLGQYKGLIHAQANCENTDILDLRNQPLFFFLPKVGIKKKKKFVRGLTLDSQNRMMCFCGFVVNLL